MTIQTYRTKKGTEYIAADEPLQLGQYYVAVNGLQVRPDQVFPSKNPGRYCYLYNTGSDVCTDCGEPRDICTC